MAQNTASFITPLFHQAIKNGIFPGASIAIITNTNNVKKTMFGCYGYTDYHRTQPVSMDTVYDLASLTKPLATTLAIFSLIKEKKVELSETLSSLLECKIPEDKKKITLSHLLNHSAGFEPHKPFYIQMISVPPRERLLWLRDIIVTDPLKYDIGKGQCYSDLGFMLLGLIVEKKTNTSLDEYVKNKLFIPLSIDKHLFFNNGINQIGDRVYAVTEDCPWRRRVLSGEVHDENASAMGGVAGQSGLFGDIQGVKEIVAFILDTIKGRRELGIIHRNDLLLAIRKQSELGTWGLGFDTRSEKGSSSGSKMSISSFGHLGYTGTSFWVDPETDEAIILLSNRVNKSRHNIKIKEFRPLFHDAVIEHLRK